MKKLILLFLITNFFACSSSKKNNSIQKQETTNNNIKMQSTFDKQGHRGCRGLMPENTIVAMLKALDLSVTTLEMDVVITKDKQVILSHEPFFSHEITTLPIGNTFAENVERNFNLYKMNYDSIKKYDVGLKPHPRFPQQEKIKAIKPLLKDVFAAVKEYMITRKKSFPFFNIETKTQPETDNIYHPTPAEFVDLLMKVIKENGMEDYVIIQSFDRRTLQYLHDIYPSIKTALLIEATDKYSFRKQLTDLGFSPTIYSPEQSLVNPNLIEECHTRAIKIIPWTVNDAAKIKALKAMGVDGIISDYPNLFDF